VGEHFYGEQILPKNAQQRPEFVRISVLPQGDDKVDLVGGRRPEQWLPGGGHPDDWGEVMENGKGAEVLGEVGVGSSHAKQKKVGAGVPQ
jgi:hypothetical protein